MKTAILHLLELEFAEAVAANPLAPIAFSCIVWISVTDGFKLVMRKGEFYGRIDDDRTANDGEGFVARTEDVVQQPAF